MWNSFNPSAENTIPFQVNLKNGTFSNTCFVNPSNIGNNKSPLPNKPIFVK